MSDDEGDNTVQKILFTTENITNYVPNTTIFEVVDLIVANLVKKQVATESYNTPQLLVLTQDTLVVTALYKQLRDKYKENKTDELSVRVWKLFARHLDLTDQQESLNAEVKTKTVNVYIGTPNRIKKLAQAGTIKLGSKKFKSIVFDCSLNKKQFNMLETHETRDDAFGVLTFAKKSLIKRKLKVYLAK